MTPRAEIITIGNEILIGDRVNSNAATLGLLLNSIGMPPCRMNVIGDKKSEITAAVRAAMEGSQVVLLTGGLGPTPDDVTRDTVAECFGLELQEDPELREHVESLFRARGHDMPEASRNQFLFPAGAKKIPNPYGTAAGIHIESSGKHVFALPGVPQEAEQMAREYIIPFLERTFPAAGRLSTTIRLANISESAVVPVMRNTPDRVEVSYLPHHGLLDLRLTIQTDDKHEAAAQLAEAEAVIREKFGSHVYAKGNARLTEILGIILLNRNQKLATAESCTGGLVADMLTDVPGASRWFERGWITYSNQAKEQNLGVNGQVLDQFGAVSQETAAAMAEGARFEAGVDWSLAITGIAGPDGGTAEKPVGTVWHAVSSEKETTTDLLKTTGDRNRIKLRSAHAALYHLYRRLMDS